MTSNGHPSPIPFTITATVAESRARTGVLRTSRGIVETPIFMPVGTHGSVRWHDVDTLYDVNAQMILANAYHLLLKPGTEAMKNLGGLHSFIGWDRGILTDSGGYQIFSIPHTRTITEEGAVFRSYLDGTKVLLSPETSIATQRALGSDIMMVLDVCIPSLASEQEARTAMERTHRWALRSLAARGDSHQALFAIVQGACEPHLRQESAQFLTSHPFDGYAIGGLAVGESKDEREAMTEVATALLPLERPRYLMGVGMPIDLLEAVHRGVDMFDCILPTSLGEQGVVFTQSGKINLRRKVYAQSKVPVDATCSCPACRRHTRAYLHHLLKSREPLACRLLSGHNLHFYAHLMAAIRHAIRTGTFVTFYHEQRQRLTALEAEHPPRQPPHRRPARSRGRYEIIHQHTPKGTLGTIRDTISGEKMHPADDPSEEANALYVEQPQFLRLIADINQPPLVIWDIGLGAATNAMALIHAYCNAERSTDLRRMVQLVSFEIDLDPLLLALSNSSLFPYLQHPAPHSLAKNPIWHNSTKRLRWELCHGDFLTFINAAPDPDIILYDPFSYKANSQCWSLSTFVTLYQRVANLATSLYTYSAATRVRAAMLAAGFFVAKGAGTGTKPETTIAITERAFHQAPSESLQLLDAQWFARWERSDAPYPSDLSPTQIEDFYSRVRRHPQVHLTRSPTLS